MHHTQLTCPPVGHKTFEKTLSTITIGNVVSPNQITKFIRPYACTVDHLQAEYKPGELQKVDFMEAMGIFQYPHFVGSVFRQHHQKFRDSECRVYQFQTRTSSHNIFVFGLFITDGANNLIDLCIESTDTAKRKPILMRLIRAICTPSSVATKLSH